MSFTIKKKKRLASGHCLIVLDSNLFKWGLTPFRHENMWLLHLDFKERFGFWWNECQIVGWECHKLMKKIQFVKSKLKDWNKMSF